MAENVNIYESKKRKEFNRDVRSWAREQRALMKQKIQMLTNKQKHKVLKARRIRRYGSFESSKLQKRKHLHETLKYKVYKKYDTAERVSFPFAKHGFFLAVGASRGHSYKKNPRKKADWYGFVLEHSLDELADMTERFYGDVAVDQIKFK